VAVYSATTDRSDVHLHFLNPETGNRIRYKVVDAQTSEEVERSDLVRGYEFAKDRYVTLTDEELDELKVESSDTMVVESFVPADSVPPVYFGNAYYVAPDGEAGMEAFTVIRDAMGKTGMFAITRAVFSRKERVIAIRPEGKGLMAFALREPSDIKNAGDFFEGIAEGKPDADMLSMATKLVENKAAEFQPEDFEDRYEQRIRELVEAKLKGVELEEEPEEQAPNVVNLMDALKRSLSDSGGRAKAPPRQSATVHELPVREASTKKPPRGQTPKRKSLKG
jgi:DNA end-binding protein Ku